LRGRVILATRLLGVLDSDSGKIADGGLEMRKSLRIVAALPVLFLFLGCAENVFANSVTFDFTIGGVGISASGTFTATFLSGNVYLVTSITGMQNGAAMTLLAPRTYGGNFNQVFSSAPFLGTAGLGFILAGGTTDYNIYYDSDAATYRECNSGAGPCSMVGVGIPIQFSLTQVTEPSTLMLLGSGLVGLAGMARRKFFG
jgi:hypothetical protein